MSTLTPVGGGYIALGAGTEPVGSTPACDTAAPADAVAAAAAAAVPASASGDDLYTNPQFRIDAQSGVLMLQYRDNAGKVVRQVPSEYELRSYQTGQASGKAASS